MMYKQQAGLTLMELTVVLLILFALAGVTIPYVAGTGSKALCDATDVTMANIKRAIMDRYYLDMLGQFPQDLDGLTANPAGSNYNLHYLFSQRSLGADGIPNNGDDRIHKAFDPDSATGWRQGGYLQGSITLDVNLTGNFSDSNYVHDPLIVNHFAVLDAWGRPIIIQNSPYGFRLVSAGPGNGSGIENGDIETQISGHRPATTSDDRILYLNAPTPSEDVNHSCD